jgi:diguanylate cyclase (GGDEF)-like protein
VLFGGLAMGTMLLVIAGVAFQIRAPLSRPTRALMVGAFCLGAAVFYARGVASPWVNAVQGFVDPNVFQSLTFMLAYVSMVATSCGFMLMNKERADLAAERLASLDPLTGAYNRRTFHETAERTLALARRAGQPLSIIMIDIDHFKGLNDQHGHRIGDEVLRVLAEVIRSQLRKEDLLTRFGGEEFCVMLPQVPGPARSSSRAASARRCAPTPSASTATRWSVTVSAGVAARLDEGPESLEDLLGRGRPGALAREESRPQPRRRTVARTVGRRVEFAACISSTSPTRCARGATGSAPSWTSSSRSIPTQRSTS